jgi:hypothetical protein
MQKLDKLMGELKVDFSITELGEMKKNLGNRIERDRDKGNLTIFQGHCMDTILACFGTLNAYSVSMLTKLTALLDQPGPSTKVLYTKEIQFTTSYAPEHWTAVKHLLRYLQGSCDDGITFKRDTGLELRIFVNSDYANRSDALSISYIPTYVATLGEEAITWSSKKQHTITLSAMEAEYMALTKGTKQLIWLRRFIQDLGIDQTLPTSLQSDNLGAITLSHDATYHALKSYY